MNHFFLWKCKSFWDRKCLAWWTRTPTLWIHAECSNHLSYWGYVFLSCIYPLIFLLHFLIPDCPTHYLISSIFTPFVTFPPLPLQFISPLSSCSFIFTSFPLSSSHEFPPSSLPFLSHVPYSLLSFMFLSLPLTSCLSLVWSFSSYSPSFCIHDGLS